ncbi:hypothetical protein [Sulfurimonas sp.]|uniref:hypothetical protein n=1 Tax=Sulfurimonas sp. TaxID=2022749 RepID=UPI0025F691FC|nr:hypothetical protein [Sulfurimonas sp.]MDD5158204.1 hypothetical protein [Sulfurimonas sp.]
MALENSYDVPLHDIKQIVEIEDYSLYYFIGAVTISALLIALAVFLLYKWNKKKSKFNIRKEHEKLLNLVDLNDTKNAAYAITLYGLTFKNDSPRHKEMYENLLSRLEGYKYKKSVDEFDSETIGYIELFKGMIDA